MHGSRQGTAVDYLAQQMRAWFQTLNYTFEDYEMRSQGSFEWIINVHYHHRYDRILIRGIEGEAKVHHVTEMRKAVKKHRGDGGWIIAVRRVSPAARQKVDGDRTVSCYIRIWDLSTSPISLIATFSSGDQAASSVIFHSQEDLCIASGARGTVTLWDIEKKEILLQKQCTSSIYELCLSPDETLLAIGGYEDGLALLHADNLSEIWHLKDIGSMRNPVFTSTGEWIFAGSRDVGIVAVLAKSGIKVARFPAHTECEVAISPDDTFLVSVSDKEGTIQFWDVRPFVNIVDEPHIPLADCEPTDLSPFFQDPTTWPEWWKKCDLPIPPGRIPNPNFGKCLRTIQQQMNCKGLKLAGVKGLDTITINDSKEGDIKQKTAWFAERGTIMKEQSGTRKSKRTKERVEEQG